ncbi:MAG: Dam family site-specific DNA-(adenine-N6)-methyltransferase [Rhodospirillaceae bacterium]
MSQPSSLSTRPILKWAGGKQQLLPELVRRVPAVYGRYIEPFIGGGALFFALAPECAVIADANPELITLYRQVADNVEAVIAALAPLTVSEEAFYAERALRYEDLPPARAAARTLYLNKTCYNGLYRVNRHGGFNVPFGRHASPPKVCDPERLRAAARVLARAEILCGDYRMVLDRCARRGDFVFLDPPYLPVGRHADFKRYTAVQFREADHEDMAPVVEDLARRGCHVVLTNANHPRLHALYAAHDVAVVATRRHVNSKADGRRGEDAIVTVAPLAEAAA